MYNNIVYEYHLKLSMVWTKISMIFALKLRGKINIFKKTKFCLNMA